MNGNVEKYKKIALDHLKSLRESLWDISWVRFTLPLLSESIVPRQRLFFSNSRQNFLAVLPASNGAFSYFFKKAQYSITSPFSYSLRKKAAREVVPFS